MEKELERSLANLSEILLISKRDSEFHIKAKSKVWTLLVLPIKHGQRLDKSQNNIQMILLNLALLGLLLEGNLDTKISCNYSLLKGCQCRGEDVQRMTKISFRKAAPISTVTALVSNGSEAISHDR